jgi:hypothetical protein
VTVKVNDKEAPFMMKVGETGEAFFVFETRGDVPEDLRTSPLVSPTEVQDANKEPDFLSLGESQVDATTVTTTPPPTTTGDGDTAVGDEGAAGDSSPKLPLSEGEPEDGVAGKPSSPKPSLSEELGDEVAAGEGSSRKLLLSGEACY